jgi:hypothetical protein
MTDNLEVNDMTADKLILVDMHADNVEYGMIEFAISENQKYKKESCEVK